MRRPRISGTIGVWAVGFWVVLVVGLVVVNPTYAKSPDVAAPFGEHVRQVAR